jgi:hypothetical protein
MQIAAWLGHGRAGEPLGQVSGWRSDLIDMRACERIMDEREEAIRRIGTGGGSFAGRASGNAKRGGGESPLERSASRTSLS